MPVLEQAVVPERQRPRPHEAHLAAQDVDDLRNLVQRETPQDPPHPGDPRVVSDLEQRPAGFVRCLELRLPLGRAGDHRPELEHPELVLADPDPGVDVEDRPA